jgi:hypothetical protein
MEICVVTSQLRCKCANVTKILTIQAQLMSNKMVCETVTKFSDMLMKK